MSVIDDQFFISLFTRPLVLLKKFWKDFIDLCATIKLSGYSSLLFVLGRF